MIYLKPTGEPQTADAGVAVEENVCSKREIVLRHLFSLEQAVCLYTLEYCMTTDEGDFTRLLVGV